LTEKEIEIKRQILFQQAEALRRSLRRDFRDRLVEAIYSEAHRIAEAVTRTEPNLATRFDQRIDRIVTHPILGLPFMLLGLSLAFWVTIIGANYPSEMIARFLFAIGNYGSRFFEWMRMPWWVTGFLWDGMYRGLAWVVSVMLPPMAIFFPTFTILEDLGYLPRVAFNLDWLFKKVGAHGKASLDDDNGFRMQRGRCGCHAHH